ncbi:beta-ketoacyl-[acyl-carrier-protein] synthase family protein [Mycobacteroides abscessus]|uniref:Probable 3-oxoacyl-(Acyl-carrier-protein) synthase II KasA n=1 Tax=Mycobacteroides abscessus subsp. bolletii TaxID=319705 RepID=A0A9Q7SJ11_9MYCO|nr:beta-ketoacyl-[acyl-carrier-protein] synthase family protein [Mycobacteroides abscessus]EHM21212.1 3-oxoacyl-(Acyl-carrier-protein) synthase II KasA [Mycobacteroides abscessus subsp. bolletii BD]MBN7304051.1 beta-ketoacyl-[acyl-carrier-protein] synthase family protein [Mycobacteroides abscessus subsp. bolletii]MDO2967847.1 beta-ketoacyl-[acyl-carrier-protein] synthase family protein [Mycobacteroides abscessus subsp. bolletii]MDO3080070.1 beta-ketoacyl-[acyl-carrier-protein] synthase family p
MSDVNQPRHGNRVLVTGLGVVCGLGMNWQSMWDGLVNGRSAIQAWSPPDVPNFPVGYAAPVDDQAFTALFPDFGAPMEKRTRFGLAAAQQALADAGVTNAGPLGRVGVSIASEMPERESGELLSAYVDGVVDWKRVHEQQIGLDRSHAPLATGDALATEIATRSGLAGPTLNLNTACAGATHALGHGFRMIRRGETDAVIAGGAVSPLNLPIMTSLYLLGAPSTSKLYGDRLCRAFDRDRSGMVTAEGAAMVLLESESSALARGAHVYGEVAGFGSSLDAYQVTAPHPHGGGSVLAMQRALADAGVAPSEVGYVSAHGTSTPLSDAAETAAIKEVFRAGEHYRSLMVSSIKTMLGHMLAAAGAQQLISTVLSLRDGIIPPTLNLENPDPACDLDYVPGQARKADIEVAINNSLGFGGLNAALVVRRYDN